ncbi:hypothetical protein TREES_T100020451 [Tupaia chinensis]|uniref:Uncharacterized protein n=1 Tax=Tupaia chinensis TaxID=246437 RepID=L9KX21_TUPCH|nr:hypothetical protein TREES_T100020451 [Tupaia chinensis]
MPALCGWQQLSCAIYTSEALSRTAARFIWGYLKLHPAKVPVSHKAQEQLRIPWARLTTTYVQQLLTCGSHLHGIRSSEQSAEIGFGLPSRPYYNQQSIKSLRFVGNIQKCFLLSPLIFPVSTLAIGCGNPCFTMTHNAKPLSSIITSRTQPDCWTGVLYSSGP